MKAKKQTRMLSVLLSAALLLTLLVGCAKTESGTGDTEVPTEGNNAAPSGDTAKGEEVTDWVTYLTSANEMETFNILYSQDFKELRVLTNCIDSLLTNDPNGRLAANVADKWGTDDDGLNWTFHIRDGVKWVDHQGNEMADVTAEDWVYGLEWVLNFYKNKASHTSMPIEMIAGAGDYYTYTKGYSAESDAEDVAAFKAVCAKYGLADTPLTEDEAKALKLDVFSKMVGCEAPDKNTLIYHCVAALPYFDTMMTAACMYPAAGALIDKLGADGFLGCTWDNMWYSGPYTITSYTQGNEKVLTKNPKYWNEDVKLFNTVTYKMVESNDVAYQMYQNGELDDLTLTESNLQTIYRSESNPFHDQLCETRPAIYSYQLHICYDKKLADGSPDTNWNTAIANENFRRSWYYGLDLTKWLARTNSINPLKCANYTYTTTGLCFLSDGTEYSQLVRNKLGLQLPADTYNRADKDKAAQYKKQAMEELTAKGVAFPVQADYYVLGSNQTAIDTATVLKQVFSDCLGDDYVQLNIKTYVSSLSKEVRTPQLGSFYISGWGADYGDPQNCLGQEAYGLDNAFYAQSYSKINNVTDPELLTLYQTFTQKLAAANAIVNDMDARYNALADAEVYMLQHVLVIPWYINVSWQLTHVNDYSKIYAPYGTQSFRFVNWETSTAAYTAADYAALEEAHRAK